MAATSIFKFLSKSADSFQPFANQELYKPSRSFYVCGFNDNNGVVDLSTLDGELAQWLKVPLAQYYYSCLVGHFTSINFNQNRNRVHTIEFPPQFKSSEFLNTYREFQHFFMRWLHKMNVTNGNPKFIPFDTVANLAEVETVFEINRKLPNLIKNIPVPPQKGPLGFGSRLPNSIRDSFSSFNDNGSVRGLGSNYNHLFDEVSYQVVRTFLDEWKHLN